VGEVRSQLADALVTVSGASTPFSPKRIKYFGIARSSRWSENGSELRGVNGSRFVNPPSDSCPCRSYVSTKGFSTPSIIRPGRFQG
jgi:hypothetical protein